MNTPADVDFVVTWVNSEDTDLLKRRNRARSQWQVDGTANAGDERYRDWNLLKYWFRSVEQYCPWVRKIYFLHAGAAPNWLNRTHPKVELIAQDEFHPGPSETYNSHAIEAKLHLLPNLSEKFVYFNDDFFICKPLAPEFFFPDGKPYGVNVPTLLADGDDRAHAMLNAAGLINKHFERSEYWRQLVQRTIRLSSGAMLARVPLYFASSKIPPVTDHHVASPLLKSVVETAFLKESATLEYTAHAVFRSALDVAPIYYATMWHLATGQYTARSKRAVGQYFSVSTDLNRIITAIHDQKAPQICINDGRISDFNSSQQALDKAFRTVFPTKSSFEIDW
ncbi:hypothetical protein [Microbacterium sp. YY-01]|uniref:hypothetical protein n=1 Tax=Microbacterium sp. YY-01 TaxID=3421634 RepID=UPI003D170053